MNRNIVIGATAAIVVMAGAAAAGSAVAAGGSHSHTLVLTGKPLKQQALGKNQSYEIEADALKHSGKTVAFSTESCFSGGTGYQCSFAIALKGGQLLGHYTFPITTGTSSTAHGKITGGLGGFTGDKGTIKLVSSTSSLKLTLVYS